MRFRQTLTERVVEEREAAKAKRRAAVIGEDFARARIYDAIARFANPAVHGEPGELDRWILCHMSDADIFAIHGGGRFMKVIRQARDAAAIALGALDG